MAKRIVWVRFENGDVLEIEGIMTMDDVIDIGIAFMSTAGLNCISTKLVPYTEAELETVFEIAGW